MSANYYPGANEAAIEGTDKTAKTPSQAAATRRNIRMKTRKEKHMNARTKKPAKRIEVPVFETTRELGDFGTIHAVTALTDRQGTLGATAFFQKTRRIEVRMNVGHPAIRAAALSADHAMLNCYIAELCLMGVNQIRRDSGDWPWPHESWPEFSCRLRATASGAIHVTSIRSSEGKGE